MVGCHENCTPNCLTYVKMTTVVYHSLHRLRTIDVHQSASLIVFMILLIWILLSFDCVIGLVFEDLNAVLPIIYMLRHIGIPVKILLSAHYIATGNELSYSSICYLFA